MKKTITSFLHSSACAGICLAMTFVSNYSAAQQNDTSIYIPQITLEAASGYGPYIVGAQQQNLFKAYDLPEQTSKAVFRFIDADSVPVGDSHVVSGSNLDTVTWNVQLYDLNLPLSPQFHLQLTYKSDSIADYYVAYIVYPDTVSLLASAGWGPFTTNAYSFSDTTWQPVPQQLNTFTASQLPPRTYRVRFQILLADSTLFDSLTIQSQPGAFLQEAVYPSVRMDQFPLETRYLRALVYSQGGPPDGLDFHKRLSLAPQRPRLIARSEGLVLSDSIAPFIENPAVGQALLVDSVKHAQITNGPGTRMFEWFRGPMSMDVIKGDFSVEAWMRLDLENIAQNAQQEHEFMYVDSVFSISYVSEYGGTYSAFRLYAVVDGMYFQLYEAQFPNSLLGGEEWHHFAFTLNGQYNNVRKFYLDGQPLATTVDEQNIQYIELNHTDYDHALRTKPFLLGGRDNTEPTYVTAFDEVRFWHSCRTHAEILGNMNRTVLQDYFLRGYWNFDDRRNRLNVISDLSCSNNSGTLMNGAAFIPENTGLFTITDTLTIHTSNAATDTVRFAFLDQNGQVMDSTTVGAVAGAATWTYDISTLPYTVGHLRIGEICPGSPPEGFETLFSVRGIAPAPIATPRCNWGTYYQSDDNFGTINNAILVTNFPDNTSKVELGLQKDNSFYYVDDFELNSIPFVYSLTLNGTDNYIRTSSYLAAPSNFQISLWFRTTSTEGGKLIGFTDQQSGTNVTRHDREIILEKNGALRFNFISDGAVATLFGANKYNDGEWHYVSVNLNTPTGTELSVDGSVVDRTDLYYTESYNGYWVIGRNHSPGRYDRDAVAEFFEGSLACISLWTHGNTAPGPDHSPLNGAFRGSTLYKLDEGKGTQVNDSQGSNPATLEGSGRKWTKTSSISMLRWEHNMINLAPGFYTFYARVYYAGGGEQGVYYPLGIFDIEDPLPDHGFSYDFSRGLGYFNEGVQMYNTLTFLTDYTGSGDPNWKDNFVQYRFLSPAHDIIDHNIFTWTGSGQEGQLVIDMGDAPPGSYLSIQVGYNTIHDQQNVAGRFSVPVLIRPMMEPVLTGDFGPFEQAVAPGTMADPNTFSVLTEGLSDLSKITAVFYDHEGNEVATVEGESINDTLWQFTQNMAELSPPVTDMKVYYYLGAGQYLARVAGPYKIQVHKTRPDWFDFIGNDAFSGISEADDSVMFRITTPFESSYLINNSSGMSIPKWVPLIGDSECEMEMPGATAHLKYIKSEGKLALNQPPEFFQKVFNLGAGNPSTLLAAFNYSQNNSYELDDDNQLLARQNFSMGGSLTSGFDKMENIVKKLKEIILAVKVANPEKVIVSPSFEISYTGSFEYSSRLNMKVDTNTGKWGSYGNLKVDANPEHPEAYNNSASFHFYSAAAGIEFGIGAELLEGAMSAHFGVDGRFVLGFGHSYVTIPSYAERPLKSFAFQVYGRFYVDILWGWYEKTVWGPKMFYSTTLWGDDMTDAFPPAGKEKMQENLQQIPASSPLVTSFHPASIYSLAQMPRPQSGVVQAGDRLLLSWLERGESFGQRQLSCRTFDLGGRHFMPKRTVEANEHAPNSLCANSSGPATTIHVWAQSRHTSGSFTSDNPMEDFVRSQDIWYAVGNGDSLLQTGMLEDDVQTHTSGRAESKPQVVMLSPERALITWQVVDLDVPQSHIWYSMLESVGGQWQQINGNPAVQGEGVKTQVKLASSGNGQAVLVWLNTDRDLAQHSTVMSAIFDGSQWSEAVRVSAVEDNICNYLDLEFHNGYGQLVYTVFVEDPVNGHHEQLKLIPWEDGSFKTVNAVELLTDSTHHLQLPAIAISSEGRAVVAVKKEMQRPKDLFHKISQVDLLMGDLQAIHQPWQHIEAHPYVCDTTRQVWELDLAFTGTDSLLLLVQEYAMLGANAALQPQHGIVFGDPYMNLVLRCFALDEQGEVLDLDEHDFFLGVDEPAAVADHFTLAQCYPNPCNEYTTLKFGVNCTAVVQIDLFDIQGVLKTRLADQRLAAGIYEMVVSTASLAPGQYIIRLQQENSVRTVKLIVRK